MSTHEEEVLGKAYDARLMRRLLEYLRPYWLQVLIAFGAIVGASLLQLAQPYLMKVAIDDYIAQGSMEGLDGEGSGYLSLASTAKVRFGASLAAGRLAVNLLSSRDDLVVGQRRERGRLR